MHNTNRTEIDDNTKNVGNFVFITHAVVWWYIILKYIQFHYCPGKVTILF